jgi:hypothetical protein
MNRRCAVQILTTSSASVALTTRRPGDPSAADVLRAHEKRLDLAIQQVSKRRELLEEEGIKPPELPWLEAVRRVRAQ